MPGRLSDCDEELQANGKTRRQGEGETRSSRTFVALASRPFQTSVRWLEFAGGPKKSQLRTKRRYQNLARATKLWKALIDPEFTRRYWFDTRQDSDWKPEAAWKIVAPDGRVADSGEVIEIEPHRRLVLSWRHEIDPEMRAEGYSRMTYELEPQGEAVKLTIIHEMERPGSKFIGAISGGWPPNLASLKSLPAGM